MSAVDVFGKIQHFGGSKDGGIETAVVDVADGFAGGENAIFGVGDVEFCGGMSENGKGVDAFLGNAGRKPGDEHAALALALVDGALDVADTAVGALLAPLGIADIAGELARPVFGFYDVDARRGDDEVVDLGAFVGDTQFQIIENDMVIGELLREEFGHLLFAAPPPGDVAIFGGDFAEMNFIASGENEDEAAHDNADKGTALDGCNGTPQREREGGSPDDEASYLPEIQFALDGLLPKAEAGFITQNFGHVGYLEGGEGGIRSYPD